MLKITPNHAHAESNTPFSKHRLAQISHYFLSDTNKHLPIWKNTTIIPVLLGSRNDDYIAYERLAFIASINTDFTVYVIILGAQTEATAKRFLAFYTRMRRFCSH